MVLPDFKTENGLFAQGWRAVVGIDEAGRGPLAGPVVAAAAMRREGGNEKRETDDKRSKREWNLVRDSKTLSEKQRERAYEYIQKHFFIGVGMCSHETIDEMNILQATFLAMKKAIADLRVKLAHLEITQGEMIVIVDGDKPIPHTTQRQITARGGDRTVLSVAAASIAAKVTRDRIMLEYARQYPRHGFEKHKGYGTKQHLDALRRWGITPIHRASFAPVKRIIKEVRQYGG